MTTKQEKIESLERQVDALREAASQVALGLAEEVLGTAVLPALEFDTAHLTGHDDPEERSYRFTVRWGVPCPAYAVVVTTRRRVLLDGSGIPVPPDLAETLLLTALEEPTPEPEETPDA